MTFPNYLIIVNKDFNNSTLLQFAFQWLNNYSSLIYFIALLVHFPWFNLPIPWLILSFFPWWNCSCVLFNHFNVIAINTYNKSRAKLLAKETACPAIKYWCRIWRNWTNVSEWFSESYWCQYCTVFCQRVNFFTQYVHHIRKCGDWS